MKLKSLVAAAVLVAAYAIVAVGDQPYMQAARTSLQTARTELQKATPDKGGHRVNAIKLVSAALQEVTAGIQFDRKHNHVNALTNAFDQPHMQNAMTALENAKDSLEKASTDKGGHRVKALGFVNDAIDEVKKGMEAAR